MVLLSHFTANDRSWLPHGVFRFNLAALCIKLLWFCNALVLEPYVKEFLFSIQLFIYHCFSMSWITRLRKVKWYLRPGRSKCRRLLLIHRVPRILLTSHHSSFNLLAQLSLHLLCSLLLFRWIENVHRLKVQGTNAPHEHFLKILLHHMSISILHCLTSFCLIALLSQRLDLLLVSCTDRLELCLHSTIELLLVSFYLGRLKGFSPGLKHLSHLFHAVFLCLVTKYLFGMFLELLIILQGHEATHLDHAHSC